ncbi:hypothetical protein RvY_14655 [Ramazzottius varieornatus]|uniref:BRO1 domain-containing protein n=1 Tax=Ramazzottius varieornatus TaxID=947166 RepID=A0A1D1VS30_RAMVA|nr:hypothetical protein RvY_14655 [Ramazzottius varieornatus]
MEAAPRLNMLSLDVKEAKKPVIFGPVLRQFITVHYGEHSAAFDREISDLEGLRNNAVKAQKDIAGCNILKRYYCQLKLLYSRFPMREGEPAAVDFSWVDNFTGKTVEKKDIKFEEANILYNIGALHSYLGAVDRRADSDALKVACTHFQCAVYAFEKLRTEYPQMPTFDLSFDVLTFYITLMMAQAQECILEKSLLDNRKHSIIAKVAAQVVEFYRICLKTLDSEATMRMPGMDNFKEFIPRQLLELKSSYYQCMMDYHMACQAGEGEKWGERIAYLEAAVKDLDACKKLIKNSGDEDTCKAAEEFVRDIVQQKSNAAKKDNDFVYHDKVPDYKSFPAVKGVSLVKGIPFSEREFLDQDVFSRLVPMAAHERSSLYSEKKAELLRNMTENIEMKDVELMSVVSALRLEQLKVPEGFQIIPQDLLDIMAALRTEGDVLNHISRQAETLNDTTDEVRKLAAETENIISSLRSARLDKNHAAVLEQISNEMSKYSAALSAGAATGDDLQNYVQDSQETLVLLGGPVDVVKKSLPTMNLDAMPNVDLDIKELDRLVGKVEEMKNQRQSFLRDLRNSLQNDDITKRILASSDDNLSAFMDEELKKHSGIIQLLEQNMSAQEKIMEAITTVVERLADFRAHLVTTATRREEVVGNFLQAYRSYMTFVEKVNEGLDFYRNLKDNLLNVKGKAEELAKTVTPSFPAPPKVVRPPVPTQNGSSKATTPQGPTLRDYLNNRNGVPNQTLVADGTLDSLSDNLSSGYGGNLAANSSRPTLRDYLEAKKSSRSSSVNNSGPDLSFQQTTVPQTNVQTLIPAGYQDQQQAWNQQPPNGYFDGSSQHQHQTIDIQHQYQTNNIYSGYDPNYSHHQSFQTGNFQLDYSGYSNMNSGYASHTQASFPPADTSSNASTAQPYRQPARTAHIPAFPRLPTMKAPPPPPANTPALFSGQIGGSHRTESQGPSTFSSPTPPVYTQSQPPPNFNQPPNVSAYGPVNGFPVSNSTAVGNGYASATAGHAAATYPNNTAALPIGTNGSPASAPWNTALPSVPSLQDPLVKQTTNWSINPNAMPTNSLSYKLAMQSANAVKPIAQPIQAPAPIEAAPTVMDPWSQMQTPLQPTVVSRSTQPVFPDSLI